MVPRRALGWMLDDGDASRSTPACAWAWWFTTPRTLTRSRAIWTATRHGTRSTNARRGRRRRPRSAGRMSDIPDAMPRAFPAGFPSHPIPLRRGNYIVALRREPACGGGSLKGALSGPRQTPLRACAVSAPSGSAVVSDERTPAGAAYRPDGGRSRASARHKSGSLRTPHHAQRADHLQRPTPTRGGPRAGALIDEQATLAT
jgi:hypothetical protein